MIHLIDIIGIIISIILARRSFKATINADDLDEFVTHGIDFMIFTFMSLLLIIGYFMI